MVLMASMASKNIVRIRAKKFFSTKGDFHSSVYFSRLFEIYLFSSQIPSRKVFKRNSR